MKPEEHTIKEEHTITFAYNGIMISSVINGHKAGNEVAMTGDVEKVLGKIMLKTINDIKAVEMCSKIKVTINYEAIDPMLKH